MRFLRWDGSDWQLEVIDEETSGVRSYALANGRTLIEITCFLGAYQGQSLVYLASDSQTAALLVFDQFEPLLEGRDKFQQKAFDLLRSAKMAEALDLNKEDPKNKARYGADSSNKARGGRGACDSMPTPCSHCPT